MPQPLPDQEVQSAPAGDRGQLTSINAIRTETVFSRLPIHQLSKTSNTPIRILQRSSESGRVTFRWEVSPNAGYGAPRQLAFKTDKLIVDRRLDELDRPLSSRYVRLGSLREIARQLNLGGDTTKVKRALLQNASTFITAKFSFTGKEGRDGREVHIEEAFTRYNLRFRSDRFEDGSEADAVYLRLNDPFFQIINNAARRPLDYDYLQALPPAAQRFYELLSFRIFAALKHRRPEAKLRYSEYCTFAPQTHYPDRRHMQIQMAKLHRHHLKSGYISKLRYDRTTDEQGSPDWFIYYKPGPKARAEFDSFQGNRRHKPRTIDVQPSSGSQQGAGNRPTPVNDPTVNAELLRGLIERGVTETVARRTLTNANTAQQDHIADCLHYFDDQQNVGPGFLANLIRGKSKLPETFETRKQKRDREAAAAKRRQLQAEQSRLERAYADFQEAETKRYMDEQVSAEEFQFLLSQHKKKLTDQYTFWRDPQHASEVERLAKLGVRNEIAKRLTLPTFEEFLRQQKTAPQKPAAALSASDPNTQSPAPTGPPTASDEAPKPDPS